MKPIIKWVGGKTQLIDTIFQQFPLEMNHYHEPFIGGGSILLELLCRIRNQTIKVTGNIYAYDSNESLIFMYQNIQKHPHDVLQHIRLLKNEFDSIQTEKEQNGNKKIQPASKEEAMNSKEAYYYWIRLLFNRLEKNSPYSTALFIFLNKTCFRGLYRVGPNGFNVPYGNNKNPEMINEDHLRNFQQLIHPVIFQVMSFQHSLESVRENDFVYLDPPYVPEKDTSFVGYTEDGFTREHHLQLFELTKRLPCKWIMSNAFTDFITESFPDEEYHIHIINARRAIHSKNPGHKTNEVILSKK